MNALVEYDQWHPAARGNLSMKCRHCGIPWEYDWEYCPQCERNYGGAKYPATQTEAELRDVERLVRQLRGAFAEVELGGGETIHQAHLEGIFGKGEEWIAAREKDPESHWYEVPDWKLKTGFSTLSFFDVEGWRFYIPAFMSWSLQNWRTTDSTTADSVLWDLDWGHHEHWSKRYESLNRAQSEAVHDFLEFFDRYSGQDDARKAIRSYWHQFRKD
jgi:hypothetical protein